MELVKKIRIFGIIIIDYVSDNKPIVTLRFGCKFKDIAINFVEQRQFDVYGVCVCLWVSVWCKIWINLVCQAVMVLNAMIFLHLPSLSVRNSRWESCYAFE